MKRILVFLSFFGLMAAFTPLPAQTDSPATQSAPAGAPAISAANISSSPAGWKASCYKPDCNPGGRGVPSVPPTQTFGIASPSLSGSAMLLSVTTETPHTVGNTNALWTWFAPEKCDRCTKLVSHFQIKPGENSNRVSSYETDMFLFDKTDEMDFMWGLQCSLGKRVWQLDNQGHGWVDTSVPCSLSNDKFHEIVFTGHRVPGDTSCDGMPCEYFDTLSVDGQQYTIDQTLPATRLNPHWGSRIGDQFQIDSSGRGASSGNPLTTTLYVDNSEFQAFY